MALTAYLHQDFVFCSMFFETRPADSDTNV